MAKRKEAQALTPESTRQVMLRGIGDETAVFLYDQAMKALECRGQADFIAALQLRDASRWTAAINEMQDALHKLVRSGEADEKRIAAIIKNEQAAEDARRRILCSLLLMPQHKRGRPEEPKPQREEDGAAADDAWEAFDESPAGETSSALRAPSPEGEAYGADDP